MPTVLLTGATAGLGWELAHRLAAEGWTVLAHGRDEARLADLLAQLPGPARGFLADLASLSEVGQLAAAVRAEGRPPDVLVNNAGVGYGPPGEGRLLSADGYELRLAVNYLAPALLSRLVTTWTAGTTRIVNVGSANQGPFAQDDPMLDVEYSGSRAYQRSKLALTADSFWLAEELQHDGITVNCVHPASRMDTAMVRDSGVAPVATVAEGADAVLRLVTADYADRTTGAFFDGMRPGRAHPQAYDPAFRTWLGERTTEWLAPHLP